MTEGKIELSGPELRKSRNTEVFARMKNQFFQAIREREGGQGFFKGEKSSFLIF